jgi:hypothetical protein
VEEPQTFTVRKMSYGVGVSASSCELPASTRSITMRGAVRAKLYYLRGVPVAARVAEDTRNAGQQGLTRATRWAEAARLRRGLAVAAQLAAALEETALVDTSPRVSTSRESTAAQSDAGGTWTSP